MTDKQFLQLSLERPDIAIVVGLNIQLQEREKRLAEKLDKASGKKKSK